MTGCRQEILDYIRRTYGGEAEYLWLRFPSFGVFRHADNRKWYALVMDVPRARLGLPGDGVTDVLNVKVGDLLLRDILLRREGFLPGYHISRGNWISILLDGTVAPEEIFGLIDASYRTTASAGTRKAIRPPKEWLIPSNLLYYDSVHAFDGTDEIEWKQGRGIKVGDTVFMYIGTPVSAIRYKCLVTETDIPWHFSRDGLTINSLMRIRLVRRYNPSAFTLETLREEYGIFGVRGPRGVPPKLSRALAKDEPQR
ncbi:MAG: MmcQ/YjbR family DNA-binding protein [Clostridia bacterium]|nr:MmcQ/YjbR family DNA-binding protein [Clostridia bacterium]